MDANIEAHFQAELSVLRTQLNIVDEKLITLLVERFSLTNEIGKLKEIYKHPIYDQMREASIIQKLTDLIGDQYNLEADKATKLENDAKKVQLIACITEIYGEIMKQSKISQLYQLYQTK